MKNLTEVQASYLAGFVDADGSIMAQIVKKDDYVLKFQLRVTVSFHQKQKRMVLLEDIKNELGVGTIRERNDGQGVVEVVGHVNVAKLLKQLQPYLRNKQKQANLVLRICEQLGSAKSNDPYKFIELCEISDHVSSLNDSKTRKNTTETVKTQFRELGLIKD